MSQFFFPRLYGSFFNGEITVAIIVGMPRLRFVMVFLIHTLTVGLPTGSHFQFLSRALSLTPRFLGVILCGRQQKYGFDESIGIEVGTERSFGRLSSPR